VPEAPIDLATLARRLADALEAAGVPYAIGGALAYGQWAVPRATADVDITLFLDEPEWPKALDLLQREGVEGDGRVALTELQDRGSCRLKGGAFYVDLFVPSIPFYSAARSRIVLRPLVGRPAGFLTAEDLSVFKMLFFRPKDLVDIRYMLAVQGGAFDRFYVRHWLAEMVGESDERVLRWDELCREVPA